MNFRRFLDLTTATAASAARPNFGNFYTSRSKVPEQPIELYDFEACPFCRKAREAFSALSLDPIVYPCPKNGPRFRQKVIRDGGQSMFPYIVDPNTGVTMYESDDIVAYLYREYGGGPAPWYLGWSGFATATSALASAVRPLKGRRYVPARQPEKLLELYSYEGSPFCRIAREALCELELPYLLHNVPRRSPDREPYVERSGKMQVPYLVDPNTGTEMFESDDIVAYLYETYAVAA